MSISRCWVMYALLMFSGGIAADSGSFKRLVEQLPDLAGSEVLQLLSQLNQSEYLQLSAYGAFASWVHLRACEADPSLVLNLTGMPTSCQQTYYQWQQTLQFSGGNVQQAFSYANDQRNQLLIGLKCRTGELDKASCASYRATNQQYNNMMNDTNQLIIDNIGGGRCDNPGGYDWRGYCQPN